MVTNGFALSTLPTTINSYYDPQVEFLELGVAYGATTTWKLYGPDLNGRYGGLNGTGGYDADSPGLNLFNPTLSDFRGNILGYYNSAGGSNVWNAARPTGYGAVPGYRPVALANSANVPQASAWRGHWPDITGYYHIGLRDLYPVSGGWLSSDSIWNERDPNWYTFAGGDPVNRFDPDGRLGKDNLPQNLYFGTAPVMATSIQPTLYLYDGTVIPPNPNGNLVDPGQVASYTYNLVTQPTGQSFSFISPVPLPDGYGQSTSVPITHADQEMQQDDQFLKFVATAALSEVGSEFLLGGGALAADTGAQIFYRGDQAGLTSFQSYAAQAGGIENSEAVLANGNLNELMANHAIDSANPASPFISVTTDPAVARQFAGPQGTVYQIQLPPGQAILNTMNPLPESEWLVPHQILPSQIQGTLP
jgi:RHS repeat-associated protein